MTSSYAEAIARRFLARAASDAESRAMEAQAGRAEKAISCADEPGSLFCVEPAHFEAAMREWSRR